MSYIKFEEFKIDKFSLYGGNNGSKIGIIYNDKKYMLKFPIEIKTNTDIFYSNECINEHIASNIFKLLGINCQETILGKYKNKIVVACEDFEKEGYKLKDFSSIKNAMFESFEGNEKESDLELKAILKTIQNQHLVETKSLIKFFWDIFIVDALLANPHRHNGNWGFLVNEEIQKAKIAPIFDCGSCLYPQIKEADMDKILKSQKERNLMIAKNPNSIIKNKGSRINYFNFLSTTNDSNCLNSLIKITKKINLDLIYRLIDDVYDTELITSIHKEFLKRIISERYNKILLKSLEINQNIKEEAIPCQT
ncbi:HipA domain-containing protein [Anaerococcus sp. AGMB09787]|uniref:HipA domain-containing protein n=1 Tax=Anaerococcus sp. AGMB09787 TaxID=2922869 RepID=UPI001FAE976E|nr:HipA domain-containing protein [Anaerococcus sp. AGMB09787]